MASKPVGNLAKALADLRTTAEAKKFLKEFFSEDEQKKFATRWSANVEWTRHSGEVSLVDVAKIVRCAPAVVGLIEI